jgi:glycosyltransferase involved in cell wall biosynthesis
VTLDNGEIDMQMLKQGGSRILKNPEQGDISKHLITVITVSFNGGNKLEETILSVIGQTYKYVEFIVIDGGSNDNTLDLLEKYDSHINYWLSEPDKGIYAAMNKGIELSSGYWINFMNCGDRFFSEFVLTNIFGNNSQLNATILFGNWEVRYGLGKKQIRNAGIVDNLWKGSQFCHQSVFIDSSFHKSTPYNYKNKIVADFEFFYSAWKNNQSFLKINEIISSIEAGGISDKKRIAVINGWRQIVHKDFQIQFYFFARILREVFVGFIKKIKF